MEQAKKRGRPAKVAEIIEEVKKTENVEEVICGHFSLIEDKGGTYCALCGKRV